MMMIFTSLYTVVDGLFISNFAGPDAFAGMNLIAPMMMIVGGLGFMFGSGGSALASKLLGEGNDIDANRVLGTMVQASVVLVLVVSIIAFPFVDDIARALATLSPDTTEAMIENATIYGRVLLIGQFIFCIQTLFHNFFVVNETPQAGFYQTMLAGIANIVFDALFICGFKWGVLGAALGTIMGYIVGAVYAIIYMTKGKHNRLKIRLCKPKAKVIFKCCANGASDFIFNISSSIVSIVYNIQLLHYIGQNGLNAYGSIMYINFVFVSIFIGFAIGMGPVIGYNFGAQNHKELHNVITKLLILICIIGLVLTGVAELSAHGIATLFTRDPEINALTTKAIRLYSPCFFFAGFSIIITSMFTSLNNGLISGLISFFRTLVFQLVLLFVLPLIFGEDSLWWSIIVVEFLATALAFIFFFVKKKHYQY